MEMTLLRIAQEALTNVARHANTDQATVSIQLEAGAICLRVQDKGVGLGDLQIKKHPESHGMRIMRERAEAFGGSVTIRSEPGQGTTVEATIPIEQPAQAESSRPV